MSRRKAISDGEVIRAASRTLLRVGPARFTLGDVAAEAGLSPATLVQRFGSKRGLMLALARSEAAGAAGPFERARDEASGPLAALRAALIGAVSELRSPEEAANGLAITLDEISDDEMRCAAAQQAEAIERAICGLLEEAMELGELAAADVGELALSVHAAWNGAIIQWALRGAGTFEVFLDRVLGPLLAAPLAEGRPQRSGSPGRKSARPRQAAVIRKTQR